ncbi:hypothetical protein [Duganella qianjiadongensis]|uniref:Transposase n=1 Tax=Duganella qianjiadongensis TaxID=2692176 RepID=A0ABW9VQ26_9BURK|nr:hypothetical protein [Duganella qianjiadongensis]MYM39797.1 hypothetical protein [Duganella qianjiadongensis]
MSRAITDKDVRQMVEMVRAWPKNEPFKWESICEGARGILGYKPTRQALDKKPALAYAYEVKKENLRSEADKLSKVTRPRTTLEAMEKIATLQEENDQLRAEVARMAEIANRFIYNGSLHGLTRAKLMAPLPNKKNPHS